MKFLERGARTSGKVAFGLWAVFTGVYLLFVGLTAENLRNPLWYAVYSVFLWVVLLVQQYRRGSIAGESRPAEPPREAAKHALPATVAAFVLVWIFAWLIQPNQSPLPMAVMISMIVGWLGYLGRTKTATTRRQMLMLPVVLVVTLALAILLRRA